ncbi:MAG: methyltransferase domain-containing protein [Deltaproteobacteria bacterium]|nr:MAG: methyltransferase domain-containing protein [Deltaproteobacteria bacterium]
MQAEHLLAKNSHVQPAKVNAEDLRQQIRDKYSEVALMPQKGFHFHTGSFLAIMLGYNATLLDGLPSGTVESFAGTGNPFSMGDLKPGEIVLDIGSGAGFDSLIAARQVAPDGRVIGVDMTDAMLEKAAEGARQMGLTNVEFFKGLAEKLPVENGSIDVVISNGVINLCPDKEAVMSEVYRVLKSGGRFQIADIVVQKEVPQSAKDNIDLWSG